MSWAGLTIACLAATLAVVAACLIDLPPRPLYGRVTGSDSDARCPIIAGAPLAMEITAGAREPDGIAIAIAVASVARPLDIRVLDLRDGREIAHTLAHQRGWSTLHWPRRGLLPQRLRIELASEEPDAARAPAVSWARDPPATPIRLSGKVPNQNGPRSMLRYSTSLRWGLWLWLAVVPALLVAWRDERRWPLLLLVLGTVSAITSMLWWQQNYSFRYTHFDADRYGTCAQMLARFVVEPAARPTIREWLHDYPHSHTALAPAIMAIAIVLGTGATAAYLALSTLCGFASLWLMYRLLRVRLQLSPRGSLVGLTLFGCHLIVLRSFSRPITDGFGLALMLCMLDLLLARCVRGGWQNTAQLAVLAVLLPLARPQGIACLPFLAAGALWADRARAGLSWRAVLVELVVLVAVPATVLSAPYLLLDWRHNFALMMAKAAPFRSASTTSGFLACLVTVCQVLPLLSLWRWRRRRIDAKEILLLAWLVFYVGMLVLVRAPLWLRHFLPLVPALVAFASTGVDAAMQRRRLALTLVALAMCALNVAAVIYQVHLIEDVPARLRPFLTSG